MVLLECLETSGFQPIITVPKMTLEVPLHAKREYTLVEEIIIGYSNINFFILSIFKIDF